MYKQSVNILFQGVVACECIMILLHPHQNDPRGHSRSHTHPPTQTSPRRSTSGSHEKRFTVSGTSKVIMSITVEFRRGKFKSKIFERPVDIDFSQRFWTDYRFRKRSRCFVSGAYSAFGYGICVELIIHAKRY